MNGNDLATIWTITHGEEPPAPFTLGESVIPPARRLARDPRPPSVHEVDDLDVVVALEDPLQDFGGAHAAMLAAPFRHEDLD